jgi:anion-transporting  ArsA/GET3 family ATPase
MRDLTSRLDEPPTSHPLNVLELREEMESFIDKSIAVCESVDWANIFILNIRF